MSNYCKIPLLNPFKFVPHTNNPGIHFDDSWAIEQVNNFQRKIKYYQKWEKQDTTHLYIESSIAPADLIVYDVNRNSVKTFAWANVYTGIAYSIYKIDFDISDVSDGIYFLYNKIELLGITWEIISEPIHSKTVWKNTLPFKYKNSNNRFDVAFSTGIEFLFRCEAGINIEGFERESTDYYNQVRDFEILQAIPSRKFKLLIGEAPGVAPYVIDLLNRIFCCDYVSIKELQYAAKSGANFEITKYLHYPLLGAGLDLVNSYNMQSLEFADVTPLAAGIVLAYNIDTSLFAPGSIVPIIEIEQIN
jgi:hypothetical protein